MNDLLVNLKMPFVHGFLEFLDFCSKMTEVRAIERRRIYLLTFSIFSFIWMLFFFSKQSIHFKRLYFFKFSCMLSYDRSRIFKFKLGLFEGPDHFSMILIELRRIKVIGVYILEIEVGFKSFDDHCLLMPELCFSKLDCND